MILSWMNLRWSGVGKLRDLPFSKFSFLAAVFVPITATAVLVVRSFGEHLAGPIAMALTTMNLGVVLVILYFSAMLYTLASLLFDLWCPDPVKKCRTFFGYVASLNEAGKLMVDAHQVGNAGQSNQTAGLALFRALFNLDVTEAKPKWDEFDRSRPRRMQIIAALYATSIVLSAVVAFGFVPLKVWRASF